MALPTRSEPLDSTMNSISAAAVALVLATVLAGCTSGLSGRPSVIESPAAAHDTATQKARDAARRESLGAQCFGGAVVAGVVERLPLAAAHNASAAPVPSMSPEQARRAVGADDSNVVPVYCRNAEPIDVQPSKSAEAKLRDVAHWYAAKAIVIEAPVTATVRASGEAYYRHVDILDTGYKREVLLNRYGSVTNSQSEAANGGSRRLEPVLDARISAVESAHTVDVPGRYTEGWVLVQVPRDKARAYRAACEDKRMQQARYEALRACSLYRAGPVAIERPGIVPLNPEEPF